MLNAVKKKVQQTVQNGFTHLSKFVDRTRLSGLLAYRKSELGELQKLISIHKIYFPEKWGSDNREENSVVQKSAHLCLLELDKEGKQPKVSQTEISGCFVFKSPQVRGELTKDCESLFKIILFCVDARLEGAGQAYEQLNSAIMLFSAELLQWIQELASASCEIIIYQNILKRIDYLNDVLENQVFKHEPVSDHQVQKMIFIVIEYLETELLPKVKWEIDQRSARDYFKKLALHAEACSHYLINGLFYLYSDQPNAKAYDFATWRVQKVVQKQLANLMDNRLGDTFSLLTEFNTVSNSAQETPNFLAKNTNYLLTDNGEPNQQELLKLSGTPVSQRTDRPLGIHQFMQKKTLLAALVSILGNINDFGILVSAFQQAYELAGQGGDYAIYVALCNESGTLLACFSQITQKIMTNIQFIMEHANKYFKEATMENKEELWQQNYISFKKHIKKAIHEIQIAQENVLKLVKNMEFAQSMEYKKQFLEKLSNFKSTIKQLSQRTWQQSIFLEESEPLLAASTVTLTSSPSEETQEELKLIDTKKDFSNVSNTVKEVNPNPVVQLIANPKINNSPIYRKFNKKDVEQLLDEADQVIKRYENT